MHDHASIREAANAASYAQLVDADGGIVTTFMSNRIIGWLDEIDRLREILVFADGAAVTGLRLALADLYAEDCEWAQEALTRAGCHPRDREHNPC